MLDEAERRPDRLAQSQVQLVSGNSTRTLLVRIAAEHNDGDISGFVVTFDDITELLSAQRKAAWADIARRIAHEIKNPLTPIQLSAERLRRRYLKEIKKDPRPSRSAPIRSSAMSAISAGWSTSSRPSRACRRRC